MIIMPNLDVTLQLYLPKQSSSSFPFVFCTNIMISATRDKTRYMKEGVQRFVSENFFITDIYSFLIHYTEKNILYALKTFL